MTQTQLLQELEKLSPWERLEIIEKAVHLLQEDFRENAQKTILSKEKLQLTQAAQALLSDYTDDRELTCFTILDGESFHE